MTPPAAVRCIVTALVVFAVVALLLSGLLGGAMRVGSDAQYVFVGLAALLAPALGTAAGAWQARAAGATRPATAILLAAVTTLALGLLLFAANDTESSSFDVAQVVLVPLGAIIGAGVYATRWFGTTTAR